MKGDRQSQSDWTADGERREGNDNHRATGQQTVCVRVGRGGGGGGGGGVSGLGGWGRTRTGNHSATGQQTLCARERVGVRGGQ